MNWHKNQQNEHTPDLNMRDIFGLQIIQYGHTLIYAFIFTRQEENGYNEKKCQPFVPLEKSKESFITLNKKFGTVLP